MASVFGGPFQPDPSDPSACTSQPLVCGVNVHLLDLVPRPSLDLINIYP
jgi:hypothetical protein